MWFFHRLSPRVLFFVLLVVLYAPPVSAQSSPACIQPTDADRPSASAVIIVPNTVLAELPGEAELNAGDTVSLVTSGGTCAGRATLRDDVPTAIVAYGPGSDVLGTRFGFAPGEGILVHVTDTSTGITYMLNDRVTYRPCAPDQALCTDDGSFAAGTYATVETLGRSDAIPVELTSFTATRDGAAAVLQWTTQSEVNNAGFEVESKPASGSRFERLAFVRGAGTTDAVQQYRFRTEELPPGEHLFRLRQVDLDGAFMHTRVTSVTVTMDRAFRLSHPVPNPMRHRAQLTLRIREAEDVTVALFNILGQRVATLHNGPLPPTVAHTLWIDGARLATGTYFLRVTGRSGSVVRRVVVVR